MIETKEDKDKLFGEMMRYRHEMEFHKCKLHQEEKATFKAGDGKHEPFKT